MDQEDTAAVLERMGSDSRRDVETLLQMGADPEYIRVFLDLLVLTRLEEEL